MYQHVIKVFLCLLVFSLILEQLTVCFLDPWTIISRTSIFSISFFYLLLLFPVDRLGFHGVLSNNRKKGSFVHRSNCSCICMEAMGGRDSEGKLEMEMVRHVMSPFGCFFFCFLSCCVLVCCGWVEREAHMVSQNKKHMNVWVCVFCSFRLNKWMNEWMKLRGSHENLATLNLGLTRKDLTWLGLAMSRKVLTWLDLAWPGLD